MEDYKIEIGKRIETALAVSNKKQKDLAEYLDITPNTVSYFCSGKRTPNTEQLIKMSKYFGISADYLLGISDTMTVSKDVRTICAVTGLTEQAVINILSTNDEHGFKTVLNAILETKKVLLEPVLYDFYNAVERRYSNAVKLIVTFGGETKELSIEEYTEMQRMRLNKTFDKLADDVIKRLSENTSDVITRVWDSETNVIKRLSESEENG